MRVSVLLISLISLGLRNSASVPLPIGEDRGVQGKGASRGPGCTEPEPLGAGGGSWAEAPCSAPGGSAPKACVSRRKAASAATVSLREGSLPERAETPAAAPGCAKSPARQGRVRIIPCPVSVLARLLCRLAQRPHAAFRLHDGLRRVPEAPYGRSARNGTRKPSRRDRAV